MPLPSWSPPGRDPPRRDRAGGRPRAVALIPVHPGPALFAFRLLRIVLRLVTLLAVAVAVYLAVTAVQVWKTGQRYEPRAAGPERLREKEIPLL